MASREINHSIQEIEKSGGKAVYVQCDVTKSDDVSSAIKAVGSQRITGLIHASGVLRDQRIEKKTSQEFDLVYGVKVGGLLNLLNTLNIESLKHLVVFSSLAGWGGNIGQSDYATANEALRKIARKANVANTLSLCFGPWGGGGMVSPQLERYFISKGVEIIDRTGGRCRRYFFVQPYSLTHSNSTGADAVARLICENKSCNTYLVGKWGREPQKHLWGSDEKMSIRGEWNLNDVVNDHVIRGNKVVPFTVVLHRVRELISNLHPGWRHIEVQDARVLKGLSGGHVKWKLEIVKMSGQKLKCTLVDETNQGLAYRMIVSNEKTKKTTDFSFDTITTMDDSVNSNMKSFYEIGTLFHGPRFQIIEQILRVDSDSLVAKCRGSSDTGICLDVALQLMLVYVLMLERKA